MPKVSIIVPVYNVAQYLEKSIGSLINQTLDDIEIICIDDCSTDNSYELLKKYAQQDQRIKLLKQEINTGQGVVRNRGIEEATGDYIMFLDPDDWLEKDACETAYSQISHNQNDFAVFSFIQYNEQDNTSFIEDKILMPFKDMPDTSNINPSNDLKGAYIKTCYAWCQIYNRKFLINNQIKFANTRNTEEVPFCIRLWIFANSISVINKPLYVYRIRKGSTTANRINIYEDYFKVREIACNDVKRYAKGSVSNAFLIYYVRSIMYWYTKQENKKSKKLYYKDMHLLFSKLYETENLQCLENLPDYNQFISIVKNNKDTKDTILRQIFQFIFCIKNDGNYKCVTILGIKLKFKRNRN